MCQNYTLGITKTNFNAIYLIFVNENSATKSKYHNHLVLKSSENKASTYAVSKKSDYL